MTKEEMQELLDSILIPLKKFNKAINANEKLSETDEDTLYQIVFDEEANKLDIDKAVVDIAEIMKKFEVDKSTRKPLMNTDGTPMLTKEGNQKYAPAKAVVMPFLVKQVLFYLSYRYISKGVAQKDFIKELQSNGVSISHNFFSRLGMTPEYYIKVKTYNQPENPCGYNGQKKEELGVAIKNLVYQAGSHTHFVDIFGGSSSASVAMPRQDTVKYIYNELNPLVLNYVKVLADNKLYKMLQDRIQVVQYVIMKGALREEEEIESIYFKDEIDTFINSGAVGADVIWQLNKIKNENPEDFPLDYKNINNYMKVEFQKLVNNKVPSGFPYTMHKGNKVLIYGYDEKEFKGIFTKADLQNFGYIDFFIYNKLVKFIIKNFATKGDHTWNTYFYDISSIPHNKVGKDRIFDIKAPNYQTLDIIDKEAEFVQFRALGYFCYFYNIYDVNILENALKSGDSAMLVELAVAEIFRNHFDTQVAKFSTSSITGYARGFTKHRSEIILFAQDKDYVSLIEGYHNEIRRIGNFENLDCIDVIKKYMEKNVLYYSDSPYAETADYNDPKNNIGKFTEIDMYSLIYALFASSRKFIFSCRATKSGAVTDTEKKESIKRSSNENIAQSVFLPLLDYSEENKVPLYVLAIEKKDKLDTLINDNEVSELMITNFEIKSFSDSEFKNVSYKVYSYIDFLELHINNAKVTNKTTKKIEKLKEQGKL